MNASLLLAYELQKYHDLLDKVVLIDFPYLIKERKQLKIDGYTDQEIRDFEDVEDMMEWRANL